MTERRRTILEIVTEEARLCSEAAELTEAFHARLSAGDDSACDEFVGRRGAILEALLSLEAPRDAAGAELEALRTCRRQSAEAIVRVLALDREVAALLERRLNSLRTHLGALRLRRESLDRYRGAAEITATFADRVG